MQNEIIFSSEQGCKVWNTLSRISNDYNQEDHPLELESKASQLLMDILDGATLKKISAVFDKGTSCHIILRNFITIKSLPLTPVDDKQPAMDGWRIPAIALLGLLKLSGHSARSFLDEMQGRLCHMVMPAKDSKKSFLRSTKKLGFHTEVVNGYFVEEEPRPGAPVSPEIFGLLGLRNPDGIATTLLSLDYVLKNLSQEAIEELVKPQFSATSQSSFDREIVIQNVAVLKKLNGGEMGLRYSHSKLMANNARAAWALEELAFKIEQSEQVTEVVLNPGDVLILNNRTCVHGRGAISGTQKFDGMDRWLIRIYGYKFETLSRLKTVPDKKHIILVDA